MQYQNGTYIHPVNGVIYSRAPDYYEAISFEQDNPVANLVQAGDILTYEISGIDPKQMICTVYYEVLCAKGITLPEKLSAFGPSKASVCKTVEMTVSLASITDAEELATLVACLESVPGFAQSEIDVALSKDRYDIKFESASYAGLYYCITYWRFDEDVLVYEVISDPDNFEKTYDVEVTTEEYKGEWYAVYHFGTELLFDRVTGLCYAVDDTVSKHLDGVAGEA